MKTILQALQDEVHYPISDGFIENVCLKRNLEATAEVTREVVQSVSYQGAVADCLYSLVHSINFSEADKSIGSLSDKQRSLILARANSLYKSIGEPTVEDEKPLVEIL